MLSCYRTSEYNIGQVVPPDEPASRQRRRGVDAGVIEHSYTYLNCIVMLIRALASRQLPLALRCGRYQPHSAGHSLDSVPPAPGPCPRLSTLHVVDAHTHVCLATTAPPPAPTESCGNRATTERTYCHLSASAKPSPGDVAVFLLDCFHFYAFHKTRIIIQQPR